MRKFLIVTLVVLVAGLTLKKVMADKNDLRAIDKNNNGLWDDIEEAIDKRFGNTKLGDAQRQVARVLQKGMEHPVWKDLEVEYWAAYSCLEIRHGEDDEEVRTFVEVNLVNSPARSRKYIEFYSGASGLVLRPPPASEKDCK